MLRHPWTGKRDACPEAETYFNELVRREEHEAQTLANLTGWPIEGIRSKLPKR